MRTTKEQYELLDVITEAMYGGASQEPDGIDFAWWNDEQIHDFISKPGNIEKLDEDTLEALTDEVARRVDAKLKEWERPRE